jgi:hypothetical protein
MTSKNKLGSVSFSMKTSVPDFYCLPLWIVS